MKSATKILILDDSAELLDALVMFLQMNHCDVCIATSEKLFITELKRFKPDIIILDIYITGSANGREICMAIKCTEETKHIPVILMSVSKMALTKFEECHADAIIEKPFDLSDLLQKIRSLVKRNTDQTMSRKRQHTTLIPWLTGNQDENQRNVHL